MSHGRDFTFRFLRIIAILTLAVIAFPCIAIAATEYHQNFNGDASNWTASYLSDQGVSKELPLGCLAKIEPSSGRQGTGCFYLEYFGKPNENALIASCALGQLPPNHEQTIRIWLKGQDIQAAQLKVTASAKNKDAPEESIYLPKPLSGTFDWKEISITLRPRQPDLQNYRIAVGLVGSGKLWVDDVTVEAGALVSLFELPGIIRAHGRTSVLAAKEGTAPIFRFPIPQDYATQVPLTFHLDTEPPNALAEARLLRDLDQNSIAEIRLRPLKKNELVTFDWSSLVLCAPSHFENVPKVAPFPAVWSPEAAEWLQSSSAVQSDRPEFKALATELTTGTQDVVEVIRRSVKKAKEIGDQQIPPTREDGTIGITDLTAFTALKFEGSCTSNANLLVALLRASGIPARSLACYPMWAGPQQTHSIVEAYVPGFGWYPIESTKLEQPWPLYRQVIVARNPVAYENRSPYRSNIYAGVPYLQLNEPQNDDGSYSYKGTLANSEYCDHVAEAWVNFPEKSTSDQQWDTALAAARIRWENWIESKPLCASGEAMQSPLRETDVKKNISSLIDQLSP